MLKAPKKVINILCRGLMRSFTFFLLVASLVYGIAIYADDTGSEHSETLSNHQTLLNPISFSTILVSGNSSRSGYGPVRIYVTTRCRPRSPWKLRTAWRKPPSTTQSALPLEPRRPHLDKYLPCPRRLRRCSSVQAKRPLWVGDRS